jgi:hypothetical protein
MKMQGRERHGLDNPLWIGVHRQPRKQYAAPSGDREGEVNAHAS